MTNNILLTKPNTSNDPMAWLRLWQLISPTLPIGAYAYSQGLETAVEKDWVSNEQDAQQWITGVLKHSLSYLDAPILSRLYQAWQQQDWHALNYWNQILVASRESSELFNEDKQMGQALYRLLSDLINDSSTADDNLKQDNTSVAQLINQVKKIDTPSYTLVLSLATVIWHIPIQEAVRGFLWAWCENQVAAAIKLIPLGQTAGQRILSNLMPDINQAVSVAMSLDDDQIGSIAPGFAIVSAQHEVQYSRLFRS